MTTYFLEAEDVLFFRDGRPFNAGEDHHAASRFPPPPSVIQGVFRSHYLVHKGVSLNDRESIRQLIGDGSDYKGLRLSAPVLACRSENGELTRYFPTPADACPAEKKGQIQPRLVQEVKNQRLMGQGLTHLLVAPRGSEAQKAELGGYMSEADFTAYFFSGKPSNTVNQSSLFVREARLGIQLEHASRSTSEGMLYEAEFVRPREGVGVLVDMEGLSGFPSDGVMRAGGEGRALRYRALQPPDFPVQFGRSGQALPKHFKVYWVSPAWFEEGWKPSDWGAFFSGKVEVVAVAIGGYEVIGGYDLLNGEQKPSGRWLPAGSVYYFRCDGAAELKQSAVTERGAEIGYGQVVIGEWQPTKA